MGNKELKEKEQPTCGIIMPISEIDGCSSEHWTEIYNILKDVSTNANFKCNLVSDADDIGIIHNRIIENIYSSDIVICDVSCKNANVMFELGMRLAFDKPTIIIKDDITGYSFDTSVIEHLEYPRDLRFATIIRFKEKLAKKLNATYEKSQKDPNYSTFLKNFGKYKIAHLEDKEITSENYLLSAIDDLKRDVRILRNQTNPNFENNRIADRSIRRHLAKGTMETISDEEKEIIKGYVQGYLDANNLKRPKDISNSIQQIYDEMERIEEIRDISGHRNRMEKLIRDAIGM